MSKQVLSLSEHQYQILDDLGIDAWYLHPLHEREPDDSEQIAISELVEALSASLLDAEVSNNSLPVQNSSPESHHIIIPQPQSLPASQISIDSSLNVSQEHVPEEIPEPQVPRMLSSYSSLPSNIVLAATAATAPHDNTIIFPSVLSLNQPNWEGVESAVTNLSVAAKAKAFHGFGNRTSDWVFIMPPSVHAAHNDEVVSEDVLQLMREWLTSIGLSIDDVYVTPLIKHSIKTPRDPDEWLAEHLAIVRTELELIAPQRVVIMGRIPCQQLLGTDAPLSELMTHNYSLEYVPHQSHRVHMTCLPSLEYFLKIPSEKSWLWHMTKHLGRAC